MTRKHFRAAAEVVKRIRNPAERNRSAVRFATVFRQFSETFNSKVFFQACKPKTRKVK